MAKKNMNILEVISSLGPKPKDEFQEVVRHFFPNASGYNRNCIQRDLEALGHIYTDHVQGRVHVMTPRMCVLPAQENGKSLAVLTGARPNERNLLDELHTLPFDHNQLSVEEVSGENGFPFTIYMKGASETFFDNLQKIANTHTLLQPEYQALMASSPSLSRDWYLLGDRAGTPGAWVALHNGIGSSSTESLHDCLDHHFHRDDRQPRNHQQLGNANSLQVFDPEKKNWVFWGDIRNTYDRNLLLIKIERYKYLLAKRSGDNWLLYLDKFSHDPLWAKWAILQNREGGESMLPSIEGPDFLIHHGLPLPIELHRVCSLCSGTLPVIDAKRGMIKYLKVPCVIQSHVIRKLSLKPPQSL